MRTRILTFILAGFFILPQFSLAQSGKTNSTNCPGVPGACGYPSTTTNPAARSGPNNNQSPQNGNGTLGVIYDQAKCGLDFTSASQRLGKRFSPAGINQPAPFVISGIPACAVIEKAYLWAEGSGNGMAQTATVNGPLGSANYPMAIVGQGPDKCWGYSGSYTYRADVTASVNGNGTYNISGILTNPPTSGNDMDGATLVVIWSQASAPWQGRIVIADGAIVVNGGTATYNLPINPAVCGATTGGRAFMCVGDIQMAVQSLTLNGTATPITWNWWNYVQQNATTYNAGQTTSNFSLGTSGDCFNISVVGSYFRTTTCTSCPTTTALTLTTSSTAASCAACNGSASVTVSPSGTYTYSWSPSGGTGSTATGLCAGTYTVTVSDACNTATAVVTVGSAGGGLTVTNAGQTNVLCNGQCNGSATASVTGGTAPYTYAWTPAGGNAPTASGLCAGTYTCTVTDAAGCTGTQIFTITQPPVLTTTGSQVNVLCNGQCTGSATVVPSGGTAPYSYSWAPSGSGSTATGLCAGSYTCTVTDANGCTTTQIFTITQPPALTASTTTTPATCGNPNGTATVSVSGGTPGYSYSWSPSGGSGATATGLLAGTYIVTVTDLNGCTVTATATIVNTGGPTASISAFTNVSCNGGTNGTATVTVSGGTSPYTYSWSPSGGSGPTATGLPAGNYVVTVTDANGCSTTASVTITQPTAITLTAVQTNVTCNAGCNGTAGVTASGGTPGYTYVWAPAGGNAPTASGLCAGTYTVTVTDANGCVATQIYSITQPTAISAATSFVSATCGANNGSATVTPSGGTPGYTYQWSSGGTNPTEPNLFAGTYTCTITDANLCTFTITVTVPNAGSPTATITAFTNVTCFGACDGTATVTAGSGVPPYTYAWTPSGGNGANATGLCPGSYTVTVTDANGCTATDTVIITEPPQLTVSTSQVDVLCNGNTTGSATATPAGGVPPYSYSWSGGGNGATESGLGAGPYTVTVTDDNGCTATANVTITEPPALTLAAAGFNVTCNGACDGQVVVIPNGGTPNYTFSWNTGCTNASCNNICAGTYNVTVTDMNGCIASATTTVTEPVAISITTSSVDAHCNMADGSASASATGGTGTLTYQWLGSGGPATQNYNNIAPGNYTVVVTDDNNCTDTAFVTVNNIPGVTATPGTSTNVSCFGVCDGTAICNVTGGTGTITYAWSPSGGNAASAASLCAGPYTCTVTDSAGCTSTMSVTITEPPQLTLTASAAPAAVCEGQSVTLSSTAGGGTPGYQYIWLPTGLPGSSQTFVPSATLDHTVAITDANGCTDSATVLVTVNSMPVAALSGDVLSGCAPLCVNFTDNSTGGAATSWLWDFGDGNTSTLQNPGHCYNDPGPYTVILTVTTANGCTNTITMTNYINVFANPVAAFTAGPQPTTELNPLISFTDQSTGADTWSWNFGDVLNSSSTLQHPTFEYPGNGCFDVTLTVTTVNGCVSSTVQEICIDPDVTLFVPNAFTPNADGSNDMFFPQGIGIDPDNFEMWIFDRWGNLIYYTEDMSQGWNGCVQGSSEIAQIDTYVWKIKAVDLLGKKHSLIGKVSLIR